MKYYKLEASKLAEKYEITTQGDFEDKTKRKPPYCDISHSDITRYYAICPSCLNPIQIIGLYKSERKYGKHTGKDISGLPSWNYGKYIYCPYATNERAPIDRKKRLNCIDDSVKELYNLLKTEFDRVVYILQKSFHIRCSKSFWQKALNVFLNSEGYLYPWFSEANLPYVFAYLGVHLSSLYGQRVVYGSELYKALSLNKNIELSKSPKEADYYYIKSSSSKRYIPIEVRLLHHKQKAQIGKMLIEEIQFCVDVDRIEVYREKIAFDEMYFLNLIKLTGTRAHRNKDLLDIADKTMPKI